MTATGRESRYIEFFR